MDAQRRNKFRMNMNLNLPKYQSRHNKMCKILYEYETLPLYLVRGFIREIGIEQIDEIIIPQDLINLCFKFYQHKDLVKLIDSKNNEELYLIAWEATEKEEYLFAEVIISYLLKCNDASTINLMAVLKYFMKDYKESEKYFKMASSMDPKCDIIMNNYAVLLIEQGRFNDAEKEIINAIECNPNCIKNHQQYAYILFINGKYELAAKECELMIILEPNIESYSGYAWLLEQMGQYHQSVLQYQQLIKLQPNNPIWYFWYAVLLQRCQQYNQSRINFKKCLDINPNYNCANSNYAYSLYLNQEYNDALKYIQIALDLESNNNHLCTHYYYALISIKLNNIQTAVNELYQCLDLIQLHPKQNQCKNEKGCLLIQQHHIYHLLTQLGYN